MIDDKTFLTGLGHMLVEIEAAYATPGPMGRIKGAEVAIANSERLIDLVGTGRPSCPTAPTAPSPTARSRRPTGRSRSPRPTAVPLRCSAPSSPSITSVCRGPITPAARHSCRAAVPRRPYPALPLTRHCHLPGTATYRATAHLSGTAQRAGPGRSRSSGSGSVSPRCRYRAPRQPRGRPDCATRRAACAARKSRRESHAWDLVFKPSKYNGGLARCEEREWPVMSSRPARVLPMLSGPTLRRRPVP